MRIEERLAKLGLVLPPYPVPPAGTRLPFVMVNVIGTRAIFSGHGPQAADGTFSPPFGLVGRDVTEAQGYQLAKLTALSVFASLQRELGDLDRVVRWTRVFGMVASAPGFARQPAVINGFSDLVLELWSEEAGRHARSAVGMAALPFGIAVEVEGEVEIEASA